jgi:hypothetical protein
MMDMGGDCSTIDGSWLANDSGDTDGGIMPAVSMGERKLLAYGVGKPDAGRGVLSGACEK